MQIYDLDTLPVSLRTQLAAFNVSDGDPPQDLRFIRRLQKMGHPSSDYYGVYAVERGQLLSRVETLHLPFRGRRGPQKVLGISDVLTRPDGLGRGLARALLGEVHRRETDQGRRWSFLWTHRTWGAHRLYESLGYGDVYSPPIAQRAVPRGTPASPPRGYRWSIARRRDADRLETILRRSTARRLGFVPRPPGSLRIRFRLGWRTPKNHRILREGDRVVGYANLAEDNDWSLAANEVVVLRPRDVEAMVASLEGLARGRWLTFQGTTFVRDAQGLLGSRGYAVYGKSHTVLMAKELGGAGPRGEDVRAVFSDPRFSCHRGDMF